MGALAAFAMLFYFGIILYTFPLLAPVALIFLKIFKKLVIFSDRKDMLYSLLAAFPCGFFTFELFYTEFYRLSLSRYIALKLQLYRIFDIGVLADDNIYLMLSFIFLFVSLVFNIIFAIKYNDKIYLTIISAILRTQVSVLFTVSFITFIGLLNYHWYGATKFYIGWVSSWGLGLIVTGFVAWACVRARKPDF